MFIASGGTRDLYATLADQIFIYYCRRESVCSCKLSVYFCNNAIILSLRGMQDFMILQISHPLLSLFTLLPPWLMKLWNFTRCVFSVCWVAFIPGKCSSVHIYPSNFIVNKPLRRQFYIRVVEIWWVVNTMIYTFPCQPPDICRHLSVVKSNILIQIIPSTCTKQKQWQQTFMTLWPVLMPSYTERLSVGVVSHILSIENYLFWRKDK